MPTVIWGWLFFFTFEIFLGSPEGCLLVGRMERATLLVPRVPKDQVFGVDAEGEKSGENFLLGNVSFAHAFGTAVARGAGGGMYPTAQQKFVRSFFKNTGKLLLYYNLVSSSWCLQAFFRCNFQVQISHILRGFSQIFRKCNVALIVYSHSSPFASHHSFTMSSYSLSLNSYHFCKMPVCSTT